MTEPIDQMGFEIPSQTSFKRSHRSRPGTTGGRASDVPGVEKDQYGRYILPPPSDPTVEPIPWTSVTTIVGQASGNEGLRKWTERGIMDGLAESASLRARLASTRFLEPGKARDRVRDDIREEAKTLSGLHDAREWGSACHREWEMWARMGNEYPGPPPELAADVTAGITAVLEAGLEVIKVEQVVVIEHLQVAGRLDTLYRAPNGKLRVGDWKTGKDVLTDPSKRENFACQFSGYGNCTHLLHAYPGGSAPYLWQVADELDIDREIAYLIHVHDGTARIYEVPIADAWRDFQARAITHRHSSSKGAPQFLAIGRPVQFAATIEDLEPMPVTKPNDWDEQYARRVEDVRMDMTRLGMVLVGGSGVDGDYSEVYVGPGDEITEVPVAPGPGEPTTLADPPGGTDEGTSVHEFEAFDGASGMVCTAMVLRDGGGDACGHVADHPIHDTPKAIGTLNGIGEPLQPLAKDVGAKRGCGVCGRIGHKRGSAACLGDADPQTGTNGTRVSLDRIADEQRAEVLDAWLAEQGDRVPGDGEQFATPVPASDDEFCDGKCQHPVPPGLEPARDTSGNVTGTYVCAGCGKRATVAAVRAHLATVRTPDGYVKPDEPAEQQAAKERVVQPATIPDPPAQGIQWGKIFSACTTREQLAAEVAECQRLGHFTPMRQETAATLWSVLPDEG